MSSRSRASRRQAHQKKSKKWAIWLPLSALAIIALSVLGVTYWIDSFLRSEAFRELINEKTSTLLRAKCSASPFQWQGWSVYSDRFEGIGEGETFFSTLRADGVRAEFDVAAVLQGAWHVPELTMRSVDFAFPEAHLPRKSVPPAEPHVEERPPGWNWLPKRFDLDKINAEAVTARWRVGAGGQGRIENARVTLLPRQQMVEVMATGGTVIQPGAPKLEMENFSARFQKEHLYITDASFRLNEGGRIRLSGEADFQNEPSRVTMHATLEAISVTPFLPEDWRARLHGGVNGTIEMEGDPGKMETLTAKGTLMLVEGRLEALPLLNELATFLKTEQLRSMPLQKGLAKFTLRGGVLDVEQFSLESQGLFKSHGAFKVLADGVLDGACQVGVSVRVLQWLPALSAKIFETEHEGFVWTTVKIGGTTTKPNEDLSLRLAKAAAELITAPVKTVLEKSGEATKEATKVLEDTASDAIDLLKPFVP